MSTNITVKRVPDDATRVGPVFAEMDALLQRIRARAYELCAQRGFRAGRDLDDWLQAEQELSSPAVELLEDETSYQLKAAVAGFGPNEIEVAAMPRELIVRAASETRHGGTPTELSKATVRWSELRERQLCRRVGLPAAIDVNQVTASLRDGMLTVKAVKQPAAAPGKVSVAAAA